MHTLEELIGTREPAWPLVQGWLAESALPHEVLPCAREAGERALLEAQVTTRSPMGTIAYQAAGILIDAGWLRFLGAGRHERFPRSLPEWNRGRADGFYLVADDAVGGFFALGRQLTATQDR